MFSNFKLIKFYFRHFIKKFLVICYIIKLIFFKNSQLCECFIFYVETKQKKVSKENIDLYDDDVVDVDYDSR